jgi:SPP1 gp7 family putative phage head morphogenesis protein
VPEVISNRSRRSAVPPVPGVVTRPDSANAPNGGMPIGVVTKDAPSPLEAFWRHRYPGQHPIPYDALTVRKGLILYDAMLQDETVAYAHKLKISSRMASGWSLKPPEDDEGNPLPGSDAIKEHVQEQLEQWGRFDEFLEQMLDGTRQGFKVGEIVTRDGKIGGRRSWVLDDVLVRNSRYFAFDCDPAGRLLDDGILEYIDPNPDGGGIQATWNPASTARHSPEKFVRWSWSPLDSNAYSLYGRSDFYSVYRGFFLKDLMLKGWGETLDTYKHPTAIMIARAGLTPDQRADAANVLDQGMKRKSIVIPAEYLPEGMDPQKAVMLHEVTGKAGDFAEQLGYDDKVIMRGLLVGQLVAEVGGDGKSGSYALGRQHTAIFMKIMDAIGRSSGRAIGHTLFRRMVRWNLGDEAARLAPDLVWHAAGDAETLERAQIVTTLVEGGVVDPSEPWLREYLGGLPKMDPAIEARREEERKLRLDAETRPPEVGGAAKGKAGKLAAEDRPRGVLPEETRIDLSAVEDSLDARLLHYGAKLKDAWRAIFRGPGGLAAQGRVALDNPDITLDFRIDPTGPIAVLRAYAIESLVAGAVDSFGEVNRGQRAHGRGELSVADLVEDERLDTTVATINLDEYAQAQGVNLEKALAKMAKRIRLRQADLERFAQERIVQIREEVERQVAKVRGEMRSMVLEARSLGLAWKDVLRDQFQELEQKWIGIERDLGSETSALTETIESSAYNEGRMRMYHATPKTVVMGFLYSAILDQRTTPFCRAWDGYRAPRDHPIWNRIVPPNHWRCRSLLAAVMAGDMSASALRAAASRQPHERPQRGFSGAKFMPPVPE